MNKEVSPKKVAESKSVPEKKESLEKRSENEKRPERLLDDFDAASSEVSSNAPFVVGSRPLLKANTKSIVDKKSSVLIFLESEISEASTSTLIGDYGDWIPAGKSLRRKSKSYDGAFDEEKSVSLLVRSKSSNFDIESFEGSDGFASNPLTYSLNDLTNY